MRCIVVFYTFCLYFQLFECVPTGSSEVRRIIGGKDADEDKYQYVVRLQYQIIMLEDSIINILKQFHACTAAVLTPNWSLTAAHCFLPETLFIGRRKTSLKSILMHGPQNRTTICKVLNIVKHPAYKMRSFDIFNDIALIRHEPIRLQQYARVSALDYVTMVGQEVILTGYGITNTTVKQEIGNLNFIEVASDATTLGMPLQILDAVIVQCGKNGEAPIKGGMCIARPCGKVSGLCQGDSGGPVLHQSGVVGVNSIGSRQIEKFCFLKPHSAFYDPAGITPTSPYIDWISKTIINEVPKRKSIMHEYPETGK